MLCPEGGSHLQNETHLKEEEIIYNKNDNTSGETASGIELRSYKNLKTWKKSITHFFRNQLRSTKSNDGEGEASGSKENFEDRNIAPELKWQSLGKVFRRQSFAEHWPKSPFEHGEGSSQSKRHAIRKVLSSYFGKSPKSDSKEDK